MPTSYTNIPSPRGRGDRGQGSNSPMRRKLSPGDPSSQASRRRSDWDQCYSSDNSMVCERKKTRDHNDDHPHHRRHLAEGALAGVGAAELIRNHRNKEGEDVSHGFGHIGHAVGAGALGAVAVNEASRARNYHRSKDGHLSHSFDSHLTPRHNRNTHGRRSRSRSRSRSHSHSRAKTLTGIALGFTALAGVAAVTRSKTNYGRRSHSRSSLRNRVL